MLILINILVVSFFAFQGYWLKMEQKNKLESLLVANNEVVLGVAARNSNCVINGALPDANCTPGAVFAMATKEEICVPGYTKTVRNVSVTTKKKVYEMYGIEYPQKSGTYEVDHHIPLALGGNNEIANLWPEAAEPKPGFKEKDVVEVYLHEKVCANQIDMVAAQKQIATDWMAVYKIISMDEQKRIRSGYKNWAN